MKAILKIFAVPKSRKCAVCGTRGDAIKIQITAPPIEGRANKEIISFVAKVIGVGRKDIAIKSGESGRYKILEIAGIDTETARKKLLESGAFQDTGK